MTSLSPFQLAAFAALACSAPTVLALIVGALVVLPAATSEADEQEPAHEDESSEMGWRDPAPEYTPDMLCAGACMLVTSPEIRQVQDEAKAITSFGTLRMRSKKHIRPLFDLIRDLFKGE